ncbi:Aste57867_22622 [Aphanomyces stellatus]|uniref:Aste57867_22622 protein n=1 Tax=Aphanomyces stellatus TaxID=120398 RepID=A0A485LKR9_9STRA|nr:hypothetical protein As57867_022552 [Aphanomyces stellatus]VFT99278.1 Aste57867_22622 [Aphanomyces stellatus]
MRLHQHPALAAAAIAAATSVHPILAIDSNRPFSIDDADLRESDDQLTQPACFRMEQCAIHPNAIVYTPAVEPTYMPPVQCQLPPPLVTTSRSQLNRVDMTLWSSHDPLVFTSTPWSTHPLDGDDASSSSTPVLEDTFHIHTTLDALTANHSMAPGVYVLEASFFACADDAHRHLPAPNQCTSHLCIAFPDVWPPTATTECPARLYPSITQTVFQRNVSYYAHMKGPFDERAWLDVVHAFERWGTDVHNAPCVPDVATSRCDDVEVIVKGFGSTADEELVVGTTGGDDDDRLALLRQLDRPTAAEMDTLRLAAHAADMTLENPFPDAGPMCTKCIHAKRVLKEWVPVASCDHIGLRHHGTPRAADGDDASSSSSSSLQQCVGSETCAINHCVSFVAMDLFVASLSVSIAAWDLTQQARATLHQQGQHHVLDWQVDDDDDSSLYDQRNDMYHLVHTTQGDHVDLALDQLVQVSTHDTHRDWLVHQVRYTIHTNARDDGTSTWQPLAGTTIHVPCAPVDSKTPTRVMFTVRTWTACGELTSKRYLLTLVRVSSKVDADMMPAKELEADGLFFVDGSSSSSSSSLSASRVAFVALAMFCTAVARSLWRAQASSPRPPPMSRPHTQHRINPPRSAAAAAAAARFEEESTYFLDKAA